MAPAAMVPAAMEPAFVESLVKDSNLAALFPPKAENPHTWATSDLHTQSDQGEPGYTHTHTATSTPIVAVANANRKSARE